MTDRLTRRTLIEHTGADTLGDSPRERLRELRTLAGEHLPGDVAEHFAIFKCDHCGATITAEGPASADVAGVMELAVRGWTRDGALDVCPLCRTREGVMYEVVITDGPAQGWRYSTSIEPDERIAIAPQKYEAAVATGTAFMRVLIDEPEWPGQCTYRRGPIEPLSNLADRFGGDVQVNYTLERT